MCWKTGKTRSEEFLPETLQRAGIKCGGGKSLWKDFREMVPWQHTHRQHGQATDPTTNKHSTKSSSCKAPKTGGVGVEVLQPISCLLEQDLRRVGSMLSNTIYHSLWDCGYSCFGRVWFWSPSHLPPDSLHAVYETTHHKYSSTKLSQGGARMGFQSLVWKYITNLDSHTTMFLRGNRAS